MKQLVVNKEDLKYNITKIKNFEPSKDYTLIGVVKANGYGLGLKAYAEFLIENGVKYLAVATQEEAIELRQAINNVDILMLSALNNLDELEELAKNKITITIDSKENARYGK